MERTNLFTSCLCVPQHIVDQFYMADGRDIKNSSSAYPYISRPYDKTCVTTEDKVLSEGYKISQGTYLAYTNREPRFYVNIGYSHAWWAMGSTTESAKKNVNIDYWNGPTTTQFQEIQIIAILQSGECLGQDPATTERRIEESVLDRRVPVITDTDLGISHILVHTGRHP